MPQDPEKTIAPGVVVTAQSAPVRSITGVDTAVPAFIGYTETATVDDKPAFLQPVPIASLIDYETAFGGRYVPAYRIEEGSATSHDFAAQRWDAASGTFAPKYYVVAGSRLDAQGDAGRRPLRFDLHDSIRLFYANGGDRCLVVSVGDYAQARTSTPPIDAAKLRQGLDVAAQQRGPTMLVVPDAVLLAPTGSRNGLPVSADFDALVRATLAQCGALQDRVAILDVFAADVLGPQSAAAAFEQRLAAVTGNFRDSVGDSALSYGMAYFPFVATAVVGQDELDYTYVDPAGSLATLQQILLDQAAFAYPDTAAPGPAANRNPDFLKVRGLIEQIASTNDRTTPGGRAAIAALNGALVAALPLLAQIETVILADLNLLAPSAALAGIYAQTDAADGVWEAPANVALRAVIAPSVNLTDAQQEPLNVPLDGKAIDVIRAFPDRGTLVWGARTLDGNSGDWRYVQVRRTVIFVEQSIKNALQSVVFEPNNADTWTMVTDMVSNFVFDLWKQGALQGARPTDGFVVKCGLGSTMTAQDVLDGNLIVQIGVALIRPAEFIVLRIGQKVRPGG